MGSNVFAIVHRDEEESEQCVRSGLVPNSVLKALKKDGDCAMGSMPLFNADPENRSEIVMYCKDQVWVFRESTLIN